jgi:hypothetical protein
MNGNQYFVVVSEPALSKTSSVATLTVAQAPALAPVSAGVLTGGTNVGVKFSTYVDPTTGANIANYSIPGSTILSATYRSNVPSGTIYGDIVVLNLAAPIAADTTVTVTGLLDVFNRPGSGTAPVSVVPDLVKTNVGFHSFFDTGLNSNVWAEGIDWTATTNNPSFDGIVIPTSANSFEITASGEDIWSAFDNFTYLYTKPTWKNFDARMRVLNLRNSSTWAKVGIEVRDSLYSGARHANLILNPDTGANIWENDARLTASDSALLKKPNPNSTQNSSHFNVSTFSGGGPVTFPNAWIRVVSSNNVIFTYYSKVATTPTTADWIPAGMLDLSADPYNDPMVGICVTSHANPGWTTTQVSDFSLTEFVNAPSPATMKAVYNADGSVTISWTGDGFTLKESTDLSTWTTSGLTETINGSDHSVTVTAPTGKTFYRLVYP